MGKQVYVEIGIQASMDRIWDLSQNTDSHARWDLRFSRIVPIGGDQDGFMRFRYEFRLPLHPIHGTGTSLGHRHRPDGHSTSVLKFTTADPLSPIGPGAGYWRYIPTPSGVRFMTGYDYQPGMWAVGRVLDPHVIRPLLGWATALSFDRLRLWAECDIAPETSRNAWLADAAARALGLAVSAGLLAGVVKRPTAGRAPGGRLALVSRAVLGFGAAAAVLLGPPHPAVPRAGRCLRAARDERSAQAPSALAGLTDPTARVVQG